MENSTTPIEAIGHVLQPLTNSAEHQLLAYGSVIAMRLRDCIWDELHLPSSVGISYCKTWAKG